uniref:Myb_Cef domain-containing protein n=1 Tax=Steinernema glaseri TaxID=37863 RepID=A0A1I7ZZJ6_9BILA
MCLARRLQCPAGPSPEKKERSKPREGEPSSKQNPSKAQRCEEERSVSLSMSSLILPAPQISDQEMEEIIKIGHVADSVRNMVDDNPTSTLLHDYAGSVRDATAARTARTPAAARDVVAEEAENLLALQNVETPLKGGVNTSLHDLHLNSALPQKQVVATPNTVLTAVGSTPRTVVPATPGSTLTTPSATPVRDQLNINSEGVAENARGQLRKALSALPKPKNDYELLLPEDEDDSDDQPDTEEEWVEDASDAAEARAKARALKRIEERKLRTQAFQRDLPRPAKLNEQYTKKATNKTEMSMADDLIKTEMYSLMEWDLGVKAVKPLSVLERAQAAKAIEEEITKHGEPLDAVMWAAIEQCSSELVLSNGKFNRLANLSRRDQMEALGAQFQLYREWMNKRAKKTSKIEKRLKVKLGGYMNIANGLTKKLTDLQNERSLLHMELETFRNLAAHEDKSIAKRVHKLTVDVEKQHERERDLQKKFGELQDLHWKLEQAHIKKQATVSAEAVSYDSSA